jgi:prepilin-type N-terminal cleavage/methylation domain-containing protein
VGARSRELLARAQRGFTLLEVMIATAIMAVGIVGALQLFSGSLRLAGDAGRQSNATVLARSLVDEELWRDVLEDNQRNGTEGDFSWSVTTHPIDRELIGRKEQEQPDLHDVADEMGLWLIQAEVSWEAPSGRKSLSLETARMGKLPER